MRQMNSHNDHLQQVGMVQQSHGNAQRKNIHLYSSGRDHGAGIGDFNSNTNMLSQHIPTIEKIYKAQAESSSNR